MIKHYHYNIIVMKDSKHQRTASVDSESQSSSDDQERSQKEHPRRKQSSSLHPALLPLALAVLAVLAIVVVSNHGQQQGHIRQEKEASLSHTPIQLQFNSSDTPPLHNLPHEELPPELTYNNIPLVKLEAGSQLIGANFLGGQQKSGHELWFKKRDLSCQANEVINSAAKFGQSSYLQGTVYPEITITAPSVTIPPTDPYRLQGLRQFLVKMTHKYPDKTLLVDHSDSLAVLLAGATINAPFYIVERQLMPLIDLSLILNDMYPLVSKLPPSYLYAPFDMLLTNSLNNSLDLIIKHKKNLTVILDIRQPYQAESALLRKVRLYRLIGEECEERTVEVYEPGEWRVQDKSWLTQGSYVLTTPSEELDLTFSRRQYRLKLTKPHPSHCQNLAMQKSNNASPFTLLNNLKVQPLAFNRLILLSGASQQITVFNEVFAFFRDGASFRSIYLDSGAIASFLLAVAAIPLSTNTTIKSKYSDLALFNKNLALNELEIVQASQSPIPSKSLLIISTPDRLSSLEQYFHILLVVSQQQLKLLAGFTAQKVVFTKGQCEPSTLEEVEGNNWQVGVYYLKRA